MLQDYRQTLRDIFFDRRSRNTSYSLRAYARDIGIPASNLSLILKGKKGINQKTAAAVVEQLPLLAEEKFIFCKLVEKEHARSAIVREKAAEEIENTSVLSSNITIEMMQVLGAWQYFALMELIRISKNHSVKNLASRLNFTESEVEHYLGKLLNLELIEKSGSKYKVMNDFNWSPDGVPSDIIRKAHTHILEKAKDALVTQAVEERDFTAMMFAMDKADLPQAKKELRKFIKNFASKYSKKDTAQDVYSLNLQLYNLTSSRNQK